MAATGQPPPQNQDAEDALLGGMILHGEPGVAEAARLVTTGDFYNPRNATVFDALVRAWRAGAKPTVDVALDGLRAASLHPDAAWLLDCVNFAGAVDTNAKLIVADRVRRQLLAMNHELREGAYSQAVDPYALIERVMGFLASVNAPSGKPSEDVHQLDDFLDAPESDEAEWVVPGLFRRDWRVMVVGGEGSGKSLLARQIVMTAAQGIHPLAFDAMPPIRTLLVDLENPRGALAGSCRKMRGYVNGRYERGQAWVWHRPGGFDLRSRALRAEFEANLALAKPDLVCIGPVYKSFTKAAGETDEQATAEVQSTLDDLRTRHSFALFMEHHAPQEHAGHRNMRPFGSSLWLRWPELGIGMVPENPDGDRTMELTRWRGDRMPNEWPKRLEQGTQWPWVGA